MLLTERAGNATLKAPREALACRAEVDEGRLPWSEFCRRFDLRLRCDLMVYGSRWITLASMPRRFDRHVARPQRRGRERDAADTGPQGSDRVGLEIDRELPGAPDLLHDGAQLLALEDRLVKVFDRYMMGPRRHFFPRPALP